MVRRVQSSFQPSKKARKQQNDIHVTLNTIEAVKMLTLYVLRNQGWGAGRLQKFTDKFNEYMVDVSNGLFSLSDIAVVIEEETGLTLEDLKVKTVV